MPQIGLPIRKGFAAWMRTDGKDTYVQLDFGSSWYLCNEQRVADDGQQARPTPTFWRVTFIEKPITGEGWLVAVERSGFDRFIPLGQYTWENVVERMKGWNAAEHLILDQFFHPDRGWVSVPKPAKYGDDRFTVPVSPAPGTPA